MNIKEYLKDSLFYPASGMDGRDMEILNPQTNKSVHVDYAIDKETVRNQLENDYLVLGYNPPTITEVSQNDLTPDGWRPHVMSYTSQEEKRMEHLLEAQRRFPPFALLAQFKLKQEARVEERKPESFSILHICGEACATFDALYLNSGINPIGVAILNPGEGYGDNWTSFTDPKGRLKKLIDMNHAENGALMPVWPITNTANEPCWPGYEFVNHYHILNATLFKKI